MSDMLQLVGKIKSLEDKDRQAEAYRTYGHREGLQLETLSATIT